MLRTWNTLRNRSEKSSSRTARVSRARTLTVDALEGRQMLSTASASAGAYSVSVATRNFGATDVDLYATLFRNGSVVRSNIVVANTGRVENAPTVSINANGRFAVAYVDQVSSNDTDIKLRVFNASGVAINSSQTVDTSTKNEIDPNVSINGFGRIVVAYTRQFSSTDLDVKAVQYYPTNSTGSAYSTSSFTVAAEANRNEFDPYVTVAENGDWAVAYTRRFSTTDLDVNVFVHRTGGSSVTKTVVNSSSNEDAPVIESFTGSSTITVSYRLNGGNSRPRRTLTV